ncbi:acyl carrier protein [Zobellella sp. DQSA1]|uniref:acyl carrier protein n=1 Tax=Zobellella sp. DQSA1 TaxID=3342386 RepID=UPI0035C11B44
MDNQELHTFIQELIIEAAELDPMTIDPDQDLSALGLDSLAGLEVAVNLEKKFKFKIPPTRYEEMITISGISNIVNELREQKETVTG